MSTPENCALGELFISTDQLKLNLFVCWWRC